MNIHRPLFVCRGLAGITTSQREHSARFCGIDGPMKKDQPYRAAA
jgi:hypothetical protein